MVSKTPGSKPKFQVVEHTLKCQTGSGELSFDLRIPFEKLEKMADVDSLDPKTIPRFILDNILPADGKDSVLGLQDGAEAYAILMEFAQAVGDRLGASVGESRGSSDSSGSTGEPSDGTSGTTSA